MLELQDNWQLTLFQILLANVNFYLNLVAFHAFFRLLVPFFGRGRGKTTPKQHIKPKQTVAGHFACPVGCISYNQLQNGPDSMLIKTSL